MVVWEDGLPCQPTKTLDQIRYRRLFLCDLPGMVNIGPALRYLKIDLSFPWEAPLLKQDILIAAISSRPFIGGSRLLVERYGIYRWNLAKNFLIILNFFRENFQPKVLVQDKQSLQLLALWPSRIWRKVILCLGLAETTDNYFKEQNEYAEEDLIFTSIRWRNLIKWSRV